MNKELTLKKAEKIVDDMYQKRWVECGIAIHMGNLDKLQYTELESASILLLRTELRLQQENKQLKEHIEKYEHYCKTTGIEELMKENQKYKEVIEKAIKYMKEHRYYAHTIDIDYLLEILKEVE